MKHHRPKAAVFDLGRVLLHFDYTIAITRLLSKCRMSIAEMQALINQSPLLHGYETGRLTTEEFFTQIQQSAGYGGELADFTAIFCDIFSPIEPMIALQQQIRSSGTPTYLFSNTNPLQLGYIRKTYPFLENFDGAVISYEHGAMKPEPKIYEVVEKLTGLKGPDLIYIDDRPENIAAGADRGWQAILHETPETTIAAVRAAKLIT